VGQKVINFLNIVQQWIGPINFCIKSYFIF